jgi:hypothetical protein
VTKARKPPLRFQMGPMEATTTLSAPYKRRHRKLKIGPNGHLSGNATSMIGLCQEGKSSPDALRRSAGVILFDSSPRVFWLLSRGSYSR